MPLSILMVAGTDAGKPAYNYLSFNTRNVFEASLCILPPLPLDSKFCAVPFSRYGAGPTSAHAPLPRSKLSENSHTLGEISYSMTQ